MQAKGLVKFFLVLITVICLYQIMLLIPTRSVESAADSYAQKVAAKATVADKNAATKIARTQFLDSVSTETVFSIPLLKSYTYEQLKKAQLGLGLDLKGGMSVLLQVDLRDFLLAISENSSDVDFKKALDGASARMTNAQADYISLFAEEFKKAAPARKLAEIFYRNESLKTKGVNFDSPDATVVNVLRNSATETVSQTFERLKQRIDEIGVVQPNISLDAARDIIVVELPGIENPQRARNMLQSQARLEFWEVYRASDPGIYAAFQEADKRLKAASTGVVVDTASTIAATDTSKTKVDSLAASQLGPLLSALTLAGQQPTAMIGSAPKNRIDVINGFLAQPYVRALFPRDLEFRWAQKPSNDDKGNSTGKYELYCLRRSRGVSGAALEGERVTNASSNFDTQGGQGVTVSLKMDGEGARQWGALTTRAAADQNREVAIVLDDKVVSAPRVINPITTGDSQITGSFTSQEGADLANILKVGKLPARTRIISESIVGPSLGQENINKSLMALMISLLAVVLFMGWYYSTGGWVANVALLANLFFLVGALTSSGFVLTLPGMAGIVLTMGMAVDANVIIYERIREELREGKSLALAVNEGFKNSMSAIIDGNVTTLLTAVVLIIFGIGPIKGFGVVLAIGIIFTLFTAVLFSRLIIEWWMGKGNNIKFFSAFSDRIFEGFSTDWMKMRKKAYLFSGLIIFAGVVSMFVRGFELGVDFKGGISYNVKFDKAVDDSKLRTELTQAFDNQSTVVKAVNTENTFNITTSYLVNDVTAEREDKIATKLVEGINKATGSALTIEAIRNSESAATHIISANTVGPTVADDIKKSAYWAGIIGMLVIFLYILLRFNRWQYSAGGVIALAHDVLITLSFFSLFHGILPFSMEIDQAFIAAILTIIGYSINDTVIVYDRIREYMRRYSKQPMSEVINLGINTTLKRTVITSFTVFIVLLILFIFGGSSIRGFSFALLIGVVFGTYSSIFIAAPIMMDLSKNLDLTETVIETKTAVSDETETGKRKSRRASKEA